LLELSAEALRAAGAADAGFVDPPREGAFAIAKALAESSGTPVWNAPARIVYVSCNPATLARDAGLLVHQAAIGARRRVSSTCFPHTAHVESIAVFDRAALD